MRRTLLAAAVLLFAMTGCSSVRGERVTTGFADQNAGVELQTPATSAAGAAAPVASAVEFTASMLLGDQRVSSDALLGQGSVLLTFVQPGCDLSATEGRSVADAAERHPELTYVFMHSGGDRAEYTAMADAAGLAGENVVHVVDDLGVTERFGVTAFPTTIIVDSAGALSSAVGALDAEGHERAAAVALG